MASAVELFKAKYPYLSNDLAARCRGHIPPSAAATEEESPDAAAAAAAAAACAQNELFIDLTEEPWKSAACHAGLMLTYKEFVKVYVKV